MQFYTIPRIVHEIVDSDNATPELLIFSVSLYMLIGPAMFYFFVCKTEVYKMIRDRVVKIKESASRALTSSNSTKISSGSVKFWRSRSYQTSSDESPANETSDSKPSNIEAIKYLQNGEDLGEDNLAYTGEDHSA
jgi:hypothetical protein